MLFNQHPKEAHLALRQTTDFVGREVVGLHGHQHKSFRSWRILNYLNSLSLTLVSCNITLQRPYIYIFSLIYHIF